MECNLINKESTVTTISETHLTKLQNIAKLIILDSVEEMLLKDEKVLYVDLGYGTLGINTEEDKLRFKFVPSAKFEEELISTIKNKQSPLEITVENSLITKLTQAYKDLI